MPGLIADQLPASNDQTTHVRNADRPPMVVFSGRWNSYLKTPQSN